MSGKVGVCVVVRAMLVGEALQNGLTRLANAEELVGVPGNDAARQPAPTPLYNAAEGLSQVSTTTPQGSQNGGHTNGSVRRNSVARPSPLNCPVPSYADLKKLRTKLREALVSEVGRKGSSTKGMSRAAAR